MESGESREKLERVQTHKTYTFQGAKGWRQYRILMPGRGMYHDVKRRLPYYLSDITDAWTYRTFASTIRMFFVKYVFDQPLESLSHGSNKASSPP
jgi:boron transporter